VSAHTVPVRDNPGNLVIGVRPRARTYGRDLVEIVTSRSRASLDGTAISVGGMVGPRQVDEVPPASFANGLSRVGGQVRRGGCGLRSCYGGVGRTRLAVAVECCYLVRIGRALRQRGGTGPVGIREHIPGTEAIWLKVVQPAL